MRTTKHHKDIRGMTKTICSVPSRLSREKSIISQIDKKKKKTDNI